MIKNVTKTSEQNSELKKTWIKSVYRENNTLNATQIAREVTKESGIKCTKKDVKDYLWVPSDWELESRKHLFSLNNKQYE